MENNIITKKMLRNSTIRVVAVFTFLALSVIAFISITFAWFASNREVGASGMQIVVDSRSSLSVSGIDCHPVTTISGNDYTYIVTPDSYDYGLPVKDPSEIVVAEYKHAIIIHIPCNIPEGVTAELLVKCTFPWIDNAHMPNVGRLDTEKKNYLSNIVTFSTGTQESSIVTKTTVTGPFVTGINTTPTKTMSLSLGNFTHETEDIYVIMEYDDSLFDHFSTEPSIQYENVRYYNDLMFEIREAE